jgi:hypothetical protein
MRTASSWSAQNKNARLAEERGVKTGFAHSARRLLTALTHERFHSFTEAGSRQNRQRRSAVRFGGLSFGHGLYKTFEEFEDEKAT